MYFITSTVPLLFKLATVESIQRAAHRRGNCASLSARENRSILVTKSLRPGRFSEATTGRWSTLASAPLSKEPS